MADISLATLADLAWQPAEFTYPATPIDGVTCDLVHVPALRLARLTISGVLPAARTFLGRVPAGLVPPTNACAVAQEGRRFTLNGVGGTSAIRREVYAEQVSSVTNTVAAMITWVY